MRIFNISKTNRCMMLTVAFITIFGQGCQEEIRGPILKGIKPEPVSNIRVENLPGSATIRYDLPTTGVLYVVAEYDSGQGVLRQVKSSKYVQELHLDAFKDAREYKVTLYAVGADEQESDRVEVVVNPATPSYLTIAKSLRVIETFGGVIVRAHNEGESDLAIGVFSFDSLGKPSVPEIYYTKQKNIDFSMRGYEPIPTKFGIFVRDRWGNISDTLIVEKTPFFEEELDRSLFKEVRLPTDTYLGHTSYLSDMSQMWNDDITSQNNVFLTRPNLSPIPQWFTFEIGHRAKLSRMRLWHRARFIYRAGNLKRFEVYGSNSPNPNGTWESWTKLGSFESYKPSGLPEGQESNEDIEYITQGEEFTFDAEVDAYRYYRIKVLDVWGNSSYISIQKMLVWGARQED